MVKKRWQRNIIRVIYGFLILLIIIVCIGYFFPLPPFIVKSIISRAMEKYGKGLELQYDKARIVLVRHSARVKGVRLFDPTTTGSLRVQSIEMQFKYFPFRIKSIRIENPSSVKIRIPARRDEPLEFENPIFNRLLSATHEKKIRLPRLSLQLASANVEVDLPLPEHSTKTIRFNDIKADISLESTKINVTGYSRADILGVKGHSVRFRISYKIPLNKVLVVLGSPSLLVPLKEEPQLVMALIKKPNLSFIFARYDSYDHILSKFSAEQCSIIPTRQPDASYRFKNIRLSTDISLSPGANNAIDIKKIEYKDDNLYLKASGNISSGLEKGHFYTNFTAYSKSESLFKQLQNLWRCPEEVKVNITPETAVKFDGILSGKFIPFSITHYEMNGTIHSVTVNLADKTHVAIPDMAFSIKENSALIKKMQLVGDFGTLNLDGSVQLKSEDVANQKPYIDLNFNGNGDAEFQINGRIVLNEKQFPFSTDLTVKKLSQQSLAFLLANINDIPELSQTRIKFTPSTRIAGNLHLSGWLTPFTIGNYSGDLQSKLLTISSPHLNTWSIDNLFLQFKHHSVEVKEAELHGKPGTITASGFVRKSPIPDNLIFEFNTFSNVNTSELLKFLKENLTLPEKISTILSDATFYGTIRLTLQGETQLDLSNGAKLNNLRFRSTANFENLKVILSRYVSPFEITGNISASENQVIIDKLQTKIEGIPATITGRIYNTGYFWDNPQWELNIAGKTSQTAISDLLHKFDVDKTVLVTPNGELGYSLKALREKASQDRLADSFSFKLNTDDISLNLQNRTLDVKNIKCNLWFADGELNIHSASAFVDSFPVSISGSLTPQKLNLTINSEVELARLRQELFTVLEPVIMDGKASLLLKIAFQNEKSSTTARDYSNISSYRNLLTEYSNLFTTLLSRLKNPDFYPGMIDGDVTLRNATIYYWELPVPIYNINGVAFIKGNRIEFENIVADCGSTTNTLNSGSFYLENNVPVLEVNSKVNTFYLHEWVSGWKKPVRTSPPFRKKIFKSSPDKVRFRLRIEADGDRLIFPPFQGDRFHTVLQYQNFEKGLPNVVEFSDTSCLVDGGTVNLLEGKIEINNSIPSYTWKVKADSLPIENLLSPSHKRRPKIFGRLSGDVSIFGTGKDLRNWQGEGRFSVQVSRFVQLPLFTELARKVKVPDLLNPAFSEINGHFNMENGKIHFPYIAFINPLTELAVEGKMDFETNLEFSVYLAIFSRFTKHIPIFNKLTDGIFKQVEALGGRAVKLRLSGTIDKPRYSFDPFSYEEIINKFSTFIKNNKP